MPKREPSPGESDRADFLADALIRRTEAKRKRKPLSNRYRWSGRYRSLWFCECGEVHVLDTDQPLGTVHHENNGFVVLRVPGVGLQVYRKVSQIAPDEWLTEFTLEMPQGPLSDQPWDRECAEDEVGYSQSGIAWHRGERLPE